MTAWAVLQLVHLAGAARDRALKLQSTNPRSADNHQVFFTRLQLAAAAIIRYVLNPDVDGDDGTGEADVSELFCSGRQEHLPIFRSPDQ